MTSYIHGYTQEEQARLTRMQTIINRAELEAFSLEGVRSILDVGAGLGQMTRALARAAPGARVVGVELDERQLEEARRQAESDGEGALVELRQGSATELPLEDGERFDLAHARFLLEHVRDPLAVVRAMVAAVRPGGRVVLVDDDHELLRLWPACPAFEEAWRIYWESYRETGCDPLVGRRMCGLLVEAGARPMRITTFFYGACHGMELFEPVVSNLEGVVTGATDALERAGYGEERLAAARAELARWRTLPDAALWYSLPLVEGVAPAIP